MAPFESITPEIVFKAGVILAALLLIGTGAGTLYLGLVSPTGVDLFGVEAFVLIGIGQIIGGAFFLIFGYHSPSLFSTEEAEG